MHVPEGIWCAPPVCDRHLAMLRKTSRSRKCTRVFIACTVTCIFCIFAIERISAPVCQNTPIEYQPSKIEKKWSSIISEVSSDHADWREGCEALLEDMDLIVSSSERKMERSSLYFSYHVFKNTCTGETKRVYIEPLISFLRNPLAICTNNNYEVALKDISEKTYLLVPNVDDVTTKSSQKWLFDAGASTYHTGLGGSSQSWFVDTYRIRGIEFDQIIGPFSV